MNINKYLELVTSLQFEIVGDEVWKIIKFEGLDEEFKVFEKEKWLMATLPISKKDKIGLQRFTDKVVHKFCEFDYYLKEKYNLIYIDLIDYENGIVRIVFPKKIIKDKKRLLKNLHIYL